MTEQEFSHLDPGGRLRMVDVSTKESTRRVALASCLVTTGADPRATPRPDPGSDAIVTARLAGIQAAKRTSDIIPLCHPLALSHVSVDVTAHPRGYEVTAAVVCDGRTGVEMEALTACSFAALTLLSHLFEGNTGARIEDLALDRKSGGNSGDWGRNVHDDG
jgi:cyclic pyranopterin monophosphate synthase